MIMGKDRRTQTMKAQNKGCTIAIRKTPKQYIHITFRGEEVYFKDEELKFKLPLQTTQGNSWSVSILCRAQPENNGTA